MQVEVEDVLSCSRAVVLPQVDAGRAELVADDCGQHMRDGHGSGGLVRLDRPDVLPVRARDDQRVAPGRRRLAEKGDHPIVLVDPFLVTPPGDDVAEDARVAVQGTLTFTVAGALTRKMSPILGSSSQFVPTPIRYVNVPRPGSSAYTVERVVVTFRPM